MPEKMKNSKNVTARIGEDFSNEIEDIKKARIESGIDKKKKSTRKLTNLITRHRDWKKIKEDTIKLKIEGKK